MLLKRLKKGTRAGEKGQSMVEFVLVLPIFLLLLFAIVDFGMGLHAWITVTNSAREGARFGSVRAPATGACDNNPSTPATNIKCRVTETAGSLPGSSTCPPLCVTITNAQGTPGQSVVVKTDYDYTLITPIDNILRLISGGTVGPKLKFSSTADMRLE